MYAVHRKARGMSNWGSTSAAAAAGGWETWECRERQGRGSGHSLPLTLAVPLVYEQLVALLAAALEAAHRVPADVVTATVVESALVNVWWRQGTPVTPWLGCSARRAQCSPPDAVPTMSWQTEETLWALMVTRGTWLLLFSVCF